MPKRYIDASRAVSLPKKLLRWLDKGSKGWNPADALKHAAAWLPLELLAECARAKPWTALAYAAAVLPPDLLAECAREWPETAMKHAAHRMPPELLAECRKLCESSSRY